MNTYKEYFQNLSVKKVKGHYAPHKAIMLVSVMYLIERWYIAQNSFVLDDELESCFIQHWKKYIGESAIFQPDPAMAFYQLNEEPFWNLRDANGNPIEKLSRTPRIGYLRKHNISAALDEDLFRKMRSTPNRGVLQSILVKQYLTPFKEDRIVSAEVSSLNAVIEDLKKQLEKANGSNDSLVDNIKTQESVIANLAAQYKSEVLKRDNKIKRLNETIVRLKSKIDTLQGILDKLPAGSVPGEQIVSSGLEEFAFLKRVDDNDLPEFPDDYRSIKYVFSRQEKVHYMIQHSELHSDEEKLSRLRVRLYEQYQANPDSPLLVCSCCKRPVLLSGNSGVKGEIIGFRHHGEGNLYTGDHAGEFFGIPKQETREALEPLKTLFMSYEFYLSELKSNESFILIPGSDRKKQFADITFSYREKNVAVIFASVGHPLDFIIRRIRKAHEEGYLPIWILAPSYFNSSALSNRDVSAFAKGLLCTIDEETVEESDNNDTPCVKVRNVYKGGDSIVTLSSFISAAEESVRALMKSPEWIESEERVKRPRIAKPGEAKKARTTVKADPAAQPALPKPKKTVSAIDYWKGKRRHLKDDLYLEKLDSGVGILDLKTQRYPVIPFYDSARITEDESEIEFYLNGEIAFRYKL